MCHHTRHKYNCGHKITTPLVHCHLHALPSVIHPVTKRHLRVASLCPSCAMSTGQAIVYPWQVDSQAVPVPVSVPVQVFTPQAHAQPRIIYQPQIQPQYQYEYQYQTYTPPQTYTAPQLIPGPGSGGTALPVPGGIPQSTRMEWRGGQWCPVTHYHFPSATSTSASASTAAAAYIPPPQVAARPPGIPANQGWSRVHGVDPGPPPPAGPPPGPAPVSSGGVSFGGNGGHFSGLSGNGDDRSGWGNFWPAGVGLSPGQAAQDPVAAQPQPQSPASSTAPGAASFPSPSSATSTSTSTTASPSIPSTPAPAPTAPTATTTSGPPATILAAAAAQAPLSFQLANPTPTPVPANVAARNARAESLLGMGSSGLARLTAANTAANAAANASWDGSVGRGRPAST